MRRLASRVAQLSGEGALAVFARARELEQDGRSVIHLELGEPDFHPAAPVVEAAKNALQAGQDRYGPSEGLPALREAIAAYLNRTRSLTVAPQNVLVTPGCKAALFLSLLGLVEPGDEVLYPEPGFPIYPSLARALGAVPVPYFLAEANRFQPDPGELVAKTTPRTRVLLLNSPSNPTGAVYESEVLRRLAELARHYDFYVLSDEIYARIVYSGKYHSIAALPSMAERTVIVDGFSKSFAMTGWRLGYAVASPEILAALNMLVVNSYTCVPEFLQHAAVEALRDSTGATLAMIAEFAQRREQFVARLNRVPGFRCRAPEGAFYAWVNVEETGLAAGPLCRMLLEEAGVAGIPGEAFGPSGERFVRFSFASSSSLLEEAIERILKNSSRWRRAAAAQSDVGKYSCP